MRPAPFALERFFARHEFTARYLLSCSDSEGMGMAELLALADPESRELWDALHLGYTESLGLPPLREQIARSYSNVEAEQILVAAPEECIFLAMNSLLEPGDHVVCTFPGYQSLYQLALSLGCEVSFWEPTEAQSWHFDPPALAGLVRPNTKLIVWNFPHNPTGALPAREDFDRILAIAEASGAAVFSDEIYRLLEPSPALRLPAAVDRLDRAISFSGMSKAYGLAGIRIGWLATKDPDLLGRMATLRDYTTICNGAPSEILALVALRAGETILGHSRRRLATNLIAAHEFFAGRSRAFQWVPPQGGTVCFPRFTGPGGAEALCGRVLTDSGILLLPSSVYGYGDSHFRLGLGRDDFPEGIARLDEHLRSLGID
jgi:aspartate/methionine/tyrosine aminotransferase